MALRHLLIRIKIPDGSSLSKAPSPNLVQEFLDTWKQILITQTVEFFKQFPLSRIEARRDLDLQANE
jgi:hypothetical protein